MTGQAWVSEDDALDYFWLRNRGKTDRLALLMQMAEVRLERPADWDSAWIRQTMDGSTGSLIRPDRCYACRSADWILHWHHLIQVQHGGSNTPRNFVAVCAVCHRRVHPWLQAPTSLQSRGFAWIGDLVTVMPGRVLGVCADTNPTLRRRREARQQYAAARPSRS